MSSDEELGFSNGTRGLQAAGALIHYLKVTQPTTEHQHIQRPRFRSLDHEMHLDSVTIRNLELIKPTFEGRDSPTLLSVLDRTMTVGGGRLLRQWMVRPLLRLHAIRTRLEAVSEFHHHLKARSPLREQLKAVQDLERLNSRISLGVANPRDLLGLQHSLEVLPKIHALLPSLESSLIQHINSEWDDLQDIYNLISTTILSRRPTFHLVTGALLKTGTMRNLMNYGKVAREGTQWIAELEARERGRTGIESLKIKFNQVFGYYIEVTKAKFIRRSRANMFESKRWSMPSALQLKSCRQLEDRITGVEHKLKNP